ncbi:hypothetical protein GGQ81_000899 [Sphingomonas desiccabilis]|nr:hypothetical protein [Sphingomonas desiccabilis]
MLPGTIITGGRRGRCGPVALLRPHAPSPRQEGQYPVIFVRFAYPSPVPAPLGARGMEAL